MRCQVRECSCLHPAALTRAAGSAHQLAGSETASKPNCSNREEETVERVKRSARSACQGPPSLSSPKHTFLRIKSTGNCSSDQVVRSNIPLQRRAWWESNALGIPLAVCQVRKFSKVSSPAAMSYPQEMGLAFPVFQ